MINTAIRIVLLNDEEQNNLQRISRRAVRDAANPLELPQTLFVKYFRVNKNGFRYFLKVCEASLPSSRMVFSVPPIVKLSACLRFFAEGGYQTGTGKDFDVGLAQSTFSRILTKMFDLFEKKLCAKWIKVPKTNVEEPTIAQRFYMKHEIPGVMGCIDGTHVNISAPSANKHLYYNRKGNYSLNVMLLCDHEQRIRCADASHPGASHDFFIWNCSALRVYFEQQYLQGVRNYWLLGDAGYPLEPWLLTPHRSPGENSTQQKFNEIHSKCRNVIERTNAVLKNLFRCLLGARELHYSPEKAAQIINACCCLHNLCIFFKSSDIYFAPPIIDLNIQHDEIVFVTSAQISNAAQHIQNEIGISLQ